MNKSTDAREKAQAAARVGWQHAHLKSLRKETRIEMESKLKPNAYESAKVPLSAYRCVEKSPRK